MSNIAYLNPELERIAANLPASYETRWNNARKAAVVHAVQGGVLSLERALALYRMSEDEFESWRRSCAPLEQPYAGLRPMRAAPPAQPARRDIAVVRPIF
jgi:hypothetical protein